MELAATSLLCIAVLIGLIALLWRLASRRQSLPCPVWLRWLVELDNPFTRTNRAVFIVEQLKLEAGMHVLDAGCGPGRLTIPLAKHVGTRGSVLAMDLQAGMLARVDAKAKAVQLNNIALLHAGIGEGRLDEARFDRVVLVTVLGEIPYREQALHELHRCLRPGGILSITEVIFDPHFQRRSTVRRLAAEAGFREIASLGNRIAYILNFEKPPGKQTAP